MSTVQIQNKGLQTHGLPGGLTIKPGLNTVDGALWDEAKTHDMVKHHIKEGTLVEGNQAATPAPAAAAPTAPAAPKDPPKHEAKGDHDKKSKPPPPSAPSK